MFGQLKIIPSANLGDMGPQKGEATGFNWKWQYSMGRWIIWLALILALVGPKTNRDIRILWILIPLAIVNLLWWIFTQKARMNSTDALEFGIIFHSMAVGLAVLWLVAHYFKEYGGIIRFGLSFATVVIIAGLGTLAYSAEFSAEIALFLTLFVFMAFTILIAIVLSRRFCRGIYRPIRFLLWLALWMLLGSFVATSGFIIVGSIIFSSGPDSAEVILIFLFAGSIFGLFLYAINLPFLILGFAHSFFRERFRACLRLKSVATTVESEGNAGEMNDEQSVS